MCTSHSPDTIIAQLDRTVLVNLASNGVSALGSMAIPSRQNACKTLFISYLENLAAATFSEHMVRGYLQNRRDPLREGAQTVPVVI